MRSKLITLRNCFNVERKFIQCVSSNRPEDRLLVVPSAFPSALQGPCGSIHLLNRIVTPFDDTMQWTITVHKQFYLNLTFLEFVFPMPYGRCDRNQGAEHLQIRHQRESMDRRLRDKVFLCGEHSPFSVIWRASSARVVYRRVLFITQIGHFRIAYQVCDQRVGIFKVQTIHHSSVLRTGDSLRFPLSKLNAFESRPKHLIYSVHLLGNRFKLLHMMFILEGTDREHISVEAFDGPGPAELHRHHVAQKVLNNEWIHFLTFQAYVQITCERYYCSGISIEYTCPSALLYAHNLTVSEEENNTNFTNLCSKGNYSYCIINIRTYTLSNIEISLQTVTFHGPDYLGGTSTTFNCLLAGVTIADGYRGNLMSRDHNDSYFKELGNISSELAIDSVFPEITTCNDTPLKYDNTAVMGFPIDKFVSFGPTLLLMVYAYEAYVDLSKSDIKVIIRPSHSAGLIVSRPSIPADGYLNIGSEDFSGSAFILRAKRQFCEGRKCPCGKVASLHPA